MTMKIYLVEDDAVIAGHVARHLEAWGYQVKTAEDFRNILGEFQAFQPQLVLLDIALPFFNGYHWCTELRKVSRVPILFLSSVSDNMNIVTAMDLGGDDFVPKPFDLSVLSAKVRSTLRRCYDFAAPQPALAHRGAELDTADASLRYRGERLDLSRNEFRILQVLLEQKGRTVSRDALMQKLWETDSFVDENTLSVNINRLRRKLDELGLSDFIRTKKGMGYLIENDE